MAITKIAYSSIEENQLNYINILRSGQSVSDIGWGTYSDAAGVNPVDGIGGSPTVTWSQNTSNPLSGDSDLRLVKDANNRQGDGVSIPFTITNRHLAKVLQISFDMELISGTYLNPILVPITGTYSITSTTCTVTATHSFVAGQSVYLAFTSGSPPANGYYTITSVTSTTFVFTVSSGSSTGNCTYSAIGDLRVSIIQDPTGTPLVLEPVNTNIQLGIANQRIRHIASFQTHISITSYRLCIHVGNASTLAYTVDFNNFKVWEPNQSVGSVITDWQSYTPTLISFGTTTSQDFQWRRVGGNMEIQGKWTAGTSTATEARIPLPLGTIDSSRVPSIRIVGTGGYNASATTYFGTYILAEPSVSYLTMGIQTSTGNALTKVNGNTMGNNTYTMFASVPIQGWGSSVAMSSDSGDGRVVAARYYTNATTTTRVTNTLAYQTRSYDTHNAYNTTTGVYTIPIQGIYQIRYAEYFSASGSVIDIYKNGTVYRNVATYGATAYSGNGVDTIQCNASDTIELRVNSGTLTSSVSLVQFFSIERISAGSQVIASSESVSVICRTISNGLTSTPTGISWTSKEVDSHNAFTASSSRFTAPMSGVYQFDLCFRSNNANSGYSQLYDVTNSAIIRTSSVPSDTSIMCGQLSTLVRLIAGQIIDVRLSQASGTSTLSSNLYDNYLSITRVGNF
jgi:hypothetical protein